MSAVLFFIAATGAIAGAIGVVLLRDPFYSVLALVAHLVSLAVLFLLLRAEFVAAVQVVVYAGAVMVLYVFVVAYVGGDDGDRFTLTQLGERMRGVGPGGSRMRFGGAVLGAALLLQRFLIPFEAASFLLLVAAVGAVVLARRRKGLEEEDAQFAADGYPVEGGRA